MINKLGNDLLLITDIKGSFEHHSAIEEMGFVEDSLPEDCARALIEVIRAEVVEDALIYRRGVPVFSEDHIAESLADYACLRYKGLQQQAIVAQIREGLERPFCYLYPRHIWMNNTFIEDGV